MLKSNKQKLNEMMSKIPNSNNGQNIDSQLLRIGILSELDAVNLYEQLAELATDDTVKKIFLDIAKEEKVHISEFNTLLNKSDNDTNSTNKQGEKEEEQIEDDNMNESRNRIYGTPMIESFNKMKNVFTKLNGK